MCSAGTMLRALSAGSRYDASACRKPRGRLPRRLAEIQPSIAEYDYATGEDVWPQIWAAGHFRRGNRMWRNLLILALLVGAIRASGQTAGTLQDEAVEWLQDYLRVNTINPPGNEIAGAEFLAAILDAEGIAFEIAESAPGRANIWARLEGGDEPALILLHHMDVVPADVESWDTDPLSGELRDGFLYGRGALNTKGLGIMQLAAFVGLHRSAVSLNRDVILMATADEEAGGFFGVGWLVDNRPELFEGVGYVLNEVGGGTVQADGGVEFGIEVTQKVPYWLHLTARGEPGHGSRPPEASSVTRLIAALERLRLHEFEARVVPAVDAYFKTIAPAMRDEWQDHFANIGAAIRTPGVMIDLQRDMPWHHALLRNACAITRLTGSDKINVVPPEVSAEIDCRLLPDQDPEAFLTELRGVLGDEIEVETIFSFTPAESPADTPLFAVLEATTLAHLPNALVAASVSTSFTDSHFLRDLGLTAYGYTPIAVPAADRGGQHGNNERISVENLRRGVAMMRDILQQFAVE